MRTGNRIRRLCLEYMANEILKHDSRGGFRTPLWRGISRMIQDLIFESHRHCHTPSQAWVGFLQGNPGRIEYIAAFLFI